MMGSLCNDVYMALFHGLLMLIGALLWIFSDWSSIEIDWAGSCDLPELSRHYGGEELQTTPKTDVKCDDNRLEWLLQQEYHARKIVNAAVSSAIRQVQSDDKYQHRRESDLRYVGLSNIHLTEDEVVVQRESGESNGRLRLASVDEPQCDMRNGTITHVNGISGSDDSLYDTPHEGAGRMWRSRGFFELLDATDDSQLRKLSASSDEGDDSPTDIIESPLVGDVVDVNMTSPPLPDVPGPPEAELTMPLVSPLSEGGDEYCDNLLDEALMQLQQHERRRLRTLTEESEIEKSTEEPDSSEPDVRDESLEFVDLIRHGSLVDKLPDHVQGAIYRRLSKADAAGDVRDDVDDLVRALPESDLWEIRRRFSLRTQEDSVPVAVHVKSSSQMDQRPVSSHPSRLNDESLIYLVRLLRSLRFGWQDQLLTEMHPSSDTTSEVDAESRKREISDWYGDHKRPDPGSEILHPEKPEFYNHVSTDY